MLAQMKLRFLYVLLLTFTFGTFTLGAPALAHNAREKQNPVTEMCRALLTARKQINPQNGPLAAAFFTSPTLFYNDGVMRTDADGGYPASNEADWHNLPWDDSPTDLVIGFGTNSAWDIASRKHAKELIIGDHVAGPLIAQNFILRPILRLAQTPAEFFSLISGIPIPVEMRNSSLFEVGQFLMDKKRTAENFKAGVKNINEWMQRQNVSREELLAVREYYFALTSKRKPNEFGVLRGNDIDSAGELNQAFADRYLPQLREEEGFSGEARPDDSFLSSQEAYSRFRNLYATAKLAHTDYVSEIFWRKVKDHGDRLGYRSYTISLTNIIDMSFLSRSQALHQLNFFRHMIYRLFPQNKYDVTIFMTTSNQAPHGFYRLERDSMIRLDQWKRHPSQGKY